MISWNSKYDYSERQHAVNRYEQWQKMREKAIRNAGGKLPPGFIEVEHPPPPPPPAIDDSDILDLSMELHAASIDDVPGDLDESGIERVPMADPGVDVSGNFVRCVTAFADDKVFECVAINACN